EVAIPARRLPDRGRDDAGPPRRAELEAAHGGEGVEREHREAPRAVGDDPAPHALPPDPQGWSLSAQRRDSKRSRRIPATSGQARMSSAASRTWSPRATALVTVSSKSRTGDLGSHCGTRR